MRLTTLFTALRNATSDIWRMHAETTQQGLIAKFTKNNIKLRYKEYLF